MTAKELNRDIKRLANEIYRISFEDQNKYLAYLESEAKKEFLRLYRADKQFEYMNKQSILIMLRLNVRHRFEAHHMFGIYIPIDKKI